MKTKKPLSLLLALLLALSLLPARNVSAQELYEISFEGCLIYNERIASIRLPGGMTYSDALWTTGQSLPLLPDTEQYSFAGWSRYAFASERDVIDPAAAEPEQDETLFAVWLKKVQDVTVYAQLPTPGESARYMNVVTQKRYNDYTVEGGMWWTRELDIGTPKAQYTGLFEAGKTYYGMLRVTPDSWRCMDLNAAVHLPEGFEQLGQEINSAGQLLVSFSAAAPQPGRIESVELFVDDIYQRQSSSDAPRTLCVTPGLISEPIDMWWTDAADVGDRDKALPSGTRFEEGAPVYSMFYLMLDPGFSVEPAQLRVELRGGTLVSKRLENTIDGEVLYIVYSAQVHPIRELELSVSPTRYEAGSIPGGFLRDDAAGYATWSEGPFTPTGEKEILAKAAPGFVFDGWYERTPDGETLLSEEPILRITHDRNRSIVVRFRREGDVSGALTVAGVPVTAENAADVLQDGVFRYDHDSLTLHIDGDCEYAGTVVSASLRGLRIQVDGRSVLRNTGGGQVLELSENTSICGRRRLSLRAGGGCGILVKNNAKLTLDQLCMDVLASTNAIRGSKGGERLELVAAELTAQSVNRNGTAISSFGSILLRDCRLAQPENGEIADGCVLNSNGSAAREVTVTTQDVEDMLYALQVDGRSVTTSNAGDILDDGVFTYDPCENVLYIKDSYDGANLTPLVQNRIDGLIISLQKDLTLLPRVDLIRSSEDCTLDGEGHRLSCSVKAGCAVAALDNEDMRTLTLRNLELNARGEGSGFSGGPAGEGALVVNSCELNLNMQQAAVSEFGNGIELIRCGIVSPQNARIQDGDILSADGKAASVLVIERIRPGAPPKFADVPESAYYANPVKWALARQITNGKSDTEFAPNEPCTRAQIVTFLWRAEGSPRSEEDGAQNPFVDVREGAYYCDAVLWAARNKITAGTDETHFAPNEPCSRAQVVTFLWRSEGRPKTGAASAGGSAGQTENPFNDVNTGAYYYDAVLWAVGSGVTKGTTSSTFSPGESCTRGQVVTFLYRSAGEG